MEPSMRIFLLLALTFVAINGSKPGAGEILLKEIIENVTETLSDSSEKILNKFVKNIFQSGDCSETTLCQAAKVLNTTHLRDTMLHRRLFAYAEYTGHHDCNLSASEILMKDFLPKIKVCCQKLLSHKKHVK